VLSCPADLNQNDLAELFDKYNLHALPVVDGQNRMVGWCRPTTSPPASETDPRSTRFSSSR